MDHVYPVPTKLKEGDLVLIKDHTAKAFQPHYVGNYRTVSFKGNQVEVCKTEGGNTTWVHLTDVKYILPVDNVITKLPNYQSFGRKTKLGLNPDRISNLHWNCHVHHIKYNSNLNDTTITHTDKHSLCLSIHKRNRVIIFLKVRFIKTHRLRLKLSPFQ